MRRAFDLLLEVAHHRQHGRANEALERMMELALLNVTQMLEVTPPIGRVN
jgi:hypothetical protein